MNNLRNSIQIPLNIEGNDQPHPNAPDASSAMETNDQPNAPPPSEADQQSDRDTPPNVYAGELEPISEDEAPPPLQPRNPSPAPRRNEEIMVYNIPLPNQVITIRLPRANGYPQVEVRHRGDRIRGGIHLMHLVLPKTILLTSMIVKSKNCPPELAAKVYYMRAVARQLE